MITLSKKNKIYLLLITLIGIFLRILWIAKINCVPISDFEVYKKIATNVYKYSTNSYMGVPVSFQGPGYTLILGLVYKLVSSSSILTAKILNLILSSLTLCIIMFIFYKLFRDKKIMLIAYTFMALNPNYIAYNNVLGSEVLLTFLFALIISLHMVNFNILVRHILLGILIGVATLTKPQFLIYIFIFFIIEWLNSKNLKAVIKGFTITLFFFLAVILPWTFRNNAIYHRFIPISYNGGYVLFINNNSSNTTGAWMPVSKISVSKTTKNKLIAAGFNYTYSVDEEVKEVMFNPKLEPVFKAEAVHWILNHPFSFFKLGIKRVKNTFFNGAGDIYAWCMTTQNTNTFLVQKPIFKKLLDFNIKLLSISGFIYIIINIGSIFKALISKNVKANYALSIPTINCLFFILIPFVFEGQPRYNFPILFMFEFCLFRLIYLCIKKFNYFFTNKQSNIQADYFTQ